MALVSYPVSSVDQTGPRQSIVRYRVQIPSGQSVSDGAYLGPVDGTAPGLWQMILHVSHAPSAADTFRLSVYGSNDGPSITPSARDWVAVRGDMASGVAGLNNTLVGVTMGGFIVVNTPARSYRFRISGATAVSDPLTLSVMMVRPNW